MDQKNIIKTLEIVKQLETRIRGLHEMPFQKAKNKPFIEEQKKYFTKQVGQLLELTDPLKQYALPQSKYDKAAFRIVVEMRGLIEELQQNTQKIKDLCSGLRKAVGNK